MNEQDKCEKVEFVSEEGGVESFYVLEQVTLGGQNYLLVADAEEGDAQAYILRETTSSSRSEETVYDMVTDQNELRVLSELFQEFVEDELELADE
ncbi:MAG: DUF1292 domain-containing protein [Clostridium sp.]|nr:DUF1292 domain-containing protein [Clostridium sp.]